MENHFGKGLMAGLFGRHLLFLQILPFIFPHLL